MKITFDTLREQLDFNQIPGWKAQYEMAPPDRQNLVDNGRFDLKKPRIASVLILIYKENGVLKFPVIHRNTYRGVHSNQIGFPGGKVEKEDANLAQTAIRESYEEINAEPNGIEILGELTELFIPPSNFLVYPYVGLYHQEPDFVPCDYEVRKIISIDFYNFLTNPQKINLVLDHHGANYQVPAFSIKHDINIWGATAMMLNEFYQFSRNSLHL